MLPVSATKKKTLLRRIRCLGKCAFRAPNRGLDTRFCRWTAVQMLAEKEISVHRHRQYPPSLTTLRSEAPRPAAPHSRAQLHPAKTAASQDRASQLGNFASQDFEIRLRLLCESFAENCGDLRRIQIVHVKLPTSIAQIRGDDDSAQKLCRKTSESWLVKFPSPSPPFRPPQARPMGPFYTPRARM